MRLHYRFTSEDVAKVKADLIFIECKKRSGKEKKSGQLLKTDGGTLLDKKLGGLITKIINEEKFAGETGKYRLIQTHGKIGAKNLLVIGVGDEKEFKLDTLRLIGAKIASAANSLKAASVAAVVQPEKVAKLAPSDRLQALAEGLSLGGYRFERYKDKKDAEKPTFKTVKLIHKGSSAPLSKAIELGTNIADAIKFSRDLVNTPGHDMTPNTLANEAKKIAKAKGLSCKVMDEKRLKRERMNLISAVSQGSLNPPRFIHIRYTPSKKTKKSVAIVGKGITFDSGGYNLKPSRHIENMKADMGGAAAVLGIMKLLPIIKPNVVVDAYIPSSENMIDGKAHKPGDVIKSRNGKTVEILNTDAEGRLLLADALDYAVGKKPDVVIDLATLTGGVRYALGEIYTAILGNDQKLIDELIAVSKEAGEPTWQLPLEKEYLKGFKESIADMSNIGKSFASTINAALFLNEFVGETKWLHLDIAESAWTDDARDYRTKGGTGAGIQTLVKFLQKY